MTKTLSDKTSITTTVGFLWALVGLFLALAIGFQTVRSQVYANQAQLEENIEAMQTTRDIVVEIRIELGKINTKLDNIENILAE